MFSVATGIFEKILAFTAILGVHVAGFGEFVAPLELKYIINTCKY